MKKKKKILLVLGILAIAFLFVAYFFLKQKEEQPVLPPPKPQIPSYFKGILPIQLIITEKEFEFPSESPVLSFTVDSISKNEASEIAKKLGFEKEPGEFEDINEGIKYFWSDDKSSLVATPKTGKIKFNLSSPKVPVVANKQLTDSSITQIATDFLVNSAIVEREKIKLTSIIPQKENFPSGGLETTTREKAKVFQVSFTYTITDYEILTIDPSTPLIFVQILPDGLVYSMEAVRLKNISKSQTLYELKSYEDLKSSLNEARLISLLNDYINISDLAPEDIKSINIDKIELVYLLDSYSSKELQPVFLLEGPAEVVGSTANKALLYLPAIK